MPISLLTKLLLYIFVVGFTPGPANVYAMTCALKHGRRHSIGMWFGLLVGFAISVTWVAIVSYLLGTTIDEYVDYLKYPGAAYILWLAWTILRSHSDTNKKTRDCTFVNGMIMQLTNAKMILFAFTTFASFVLAHHNHNVGDMVLVWALLFIAGPGANFTWLELGVWLRPFFSNHHRSVNIVMGTALIACAILILLG